MHSPALRPCAGAALMAARGLRYEVDGAALIDGLDLTIRAGRRTVVLGANGAGKSLTLRLLHGLLSPSAGQVLWRGRMLDDAARRAQAMVFQRPVLLRRSVAANLRFALKVSGLDRRERARRVAQALAQARLSDLARRPARLLSGGEQQRLALARALIGAPQALFLDEPTASLDPASTRIIEAQIDAAHRAGTSIVLVTHDLGQARRMGDDALFLHGGCVVEQGAAAQLLSAPRSAPARAWMAGRLHVGPGPEPGASGEGRRRGRPPRFSPVPKGVEGMI